MRKNKADGKNIYIDMDGVLADFNSEPDGIERFKVEKGFFKQLKPLEKNVKALNRLLADGKHKVFILSASPNKGADGDKVEWLKKYVPTMQTENIILCRNNQRKIDFIQTADGILFDDYSKNLKEWADGNRRNKCFKIEADGNLKKGLELFGLI